MQLGYGSTLYNFFKVSPFRFAGATRQAHPAASRGYRTPVKIMLDVSDTFTLV